jgi:hypothetical protein
VDFFAGIDFHPVNLPGASVGLGNRGIDDLDHHRSNVDTDTVTFDERDDRVIRDGLPRNDFLAALRDFDQTCAHANSI